MELLRERLRPALPPFPGFTRQRKIMTVERARFGGPGGRPCDMTVREKERNSCSHQR